VKIVATKKESGEAVRYQIKIVPNERPNDDGRWIDIPIVPPRTTRWTDLEEHMKAYVPAGHHVVAVQSVTR